MTKVRNGKTEVRREAKGRETNLSSFDHRLVDHLTESVHEWKRREKEKKVSSTRPNQEEQRREDEESRRIQTHMAFPPPRSSPKAPLFSSSEAFIPSRIRVARLISGKNKDGEGRVGSVTRRPTKRN